jgi:hypothetical protein
MFGLLAVVDAVVPCACADAAVTAASVADADVSRRARRFGSMAVIVLSPHGLTGEYPVAGA